MFAGSEFIVKMLFWALDIKFKEMGNPVVWFEIATNDIERSKAFYETVLQRNFSLVEMPGMKMYMFESSPEGQGAGGALIQSEESKPSADGTVIYFYSEDCAIEEARIEAAGGKVLVPKMSLGEFGFMVLFLDPDGNRIGLHSMN